MKVTIVIIGIVLIWIHQGSTVNSFTLDGEASTHKVENSKSLDHINKRAYRVVSGAVYIRWGHNECLSSQSRLVYSGYAGGSNFKYKGATTNYLCLAKDPTTSNDKTPFKWFGHLYGAEYKFNHNHKTFDVPCAVCQSHYRNSFMLPGKDICPKGWGVEYKGLLMTGYYKHLAGTEYVCVDSARKILSGSHHLDNGKLFYPVRAKCGSLRCPPYKQNQLVTCAVCSR